MKKAVVLLSAGLDSTVNLYWAKKQSQVVLALTFDYGQRAASRETERAKSQCQALGIPHEILRLDWFKDFTSSSLVNSLQEVPVSRQISIDDRETSLSTAKAVWVPNRNGIFLNIAAAFAEGLGAEQIIPGFNAEEAATFPDNSAEYITAATASLAFSTANKVEVHCYTAAMNKTQIVKKGRELGVDFSLVWPCYFAGSEPCGECESCQRFQRAMREA